MCNESEYNQVDFGVKCYMEAAYIFYSTNMDNDGYFIPIPQTILQFAAAVDSQAYYYLYHPDNSTDLYFPIYIKRVYHPQ
jgi:hypothetical protein